MAVAMPREAFVSSLNSSLRNWGFQFIQESTYHSNFRGHVLDHPVLRTETVSFDSNLAGFNSRGTEDGGFSTVLVNLVFILVCIALLFVCLLASENEAEEAVGERRSMMMSPKTKELESFQEAQSYEGSWAQAYRVASGEEREALELLFRCHIISTYEFAESKVSQEHIDECIWIGRHMLIQKPMSEWVAMRYQAKEIFEENAVACFQARSESRPGSSVQGSHLPTPLASAPNSARQLFSHRSTATPEPLFSARQPLSTSSSLSNDSQQRVILATAQVREFPIAEYEKMELHKAASQSTTITITTQPSRADSSSFEDLHVHRPLQTYAENSGAEVREKVMSKGALQAPQSDYSGEGEAQPQPSKAKKRPEVPRVNLHSLSMSKAQSSREEDDDPYTTRDIY